MTNAALYMHANAYDTSGSRLLGRHSAGESFLRGYLRHADVDRHWFYNASSSPQSALDELVARIEPPTKPVTWIPGHQRAALSQVGVLNMPVPDITAEAWTRRAIGPRAYAICGVTHTTATALVMRLVSELLVSPLEDHDALICTSSAVRDSIEAQMGLMREFLNETYGPRRCSELQRVTIPLGLNTSDFATTPEARAAWRERLGIPEDGVVALYVGRFNVRAKMNPALMAMALERAARRTGKTVYWVNSGWSETEAEDASFHEETARLCPSVRYLHVDGRKPDVRFSIWSAADFFISFSDNIQETFGLTPIEAMAAGLPAVVTDWNGYKDTVRDGVDGFRIPTLAPRPGLGTDLSYWFANHWMTYDNYVGATGQFIAVDLEAAEQALARLIEQPDLRRRMGEAARIRARETFDWSAIIPQYQALWAEQDARRRVAAPAPSRPNATRPDPYLLFAGYPTRWLASDDRISLTPAMTAEAAKARLAGPLAIYSSFSRPSEAEVAAVVESLTAEPEQSVASLLEHFPQNRRAYLERGLLWLTRHDIVSVRKG